MEVVTSASPTSWSYSIILQLQQVKTKWIQLNVQIEPLSLKGECAGLVQTVSLGE